MTIQQLGLNYTHVCGYARGYQSGSTDGFGNYGIIEGISIKAGTTHVWAYASGVQEAERNPYDYSCPCNINNTFTTPLSVGNDYYCESGILKLIMSLETPTGSQTTHSGTVSSAESQRNLAVSTTECPGLIKHYP